jgi:hypothetical protein
MSLPPPHLDADRDCTIGMLIVTERELDLDGRFSLAASGRSTKSSSH